MTLKVISSLFLRQRSTICPYRRDVVTKTAMKTLYYGGQQQHHHHHHQHTKRYLSSTGTYYDSQSGLHIPVHNEKEIKIFLNASTNSSNQESSSSFNIPHQLYKQSDMAYEMTDQIQSLIQQGIHGIVLPPLQFPRDVRNLTALRTIVPENFFLLYDDSGHHQNQHQNQTNNEDTEKLVSRIIHYGESNDNDNDSNNSKLEETLKHFVDKRLHTTLAIKEDDYHLSDVEALTLANNIASMIDSVGGCDFIWLTSTSDDSADTAVEVCEELIYLDVAGPTIKSRLLIESINEDVLEDSMFAGVNKYIIEDESHAEIIESVASEQGKALVK